MVLMLRRGVACPFATLLSAPALYESVVLCIKLSWWSLLCPLQGGYFIINGSEKVLIAQERMAWPITCMCSRRASPASTCMLRNAGEVLTQ